MLALRPCYRATLAAIAARLPAGDWGEVRLADLARARALHITTTRLHVDVLAARGLIEIGAIERPHSLRWLSGRMRLTAAGRLAA